MPRDPGDLLGSFDAPRRQPPGGAETATDGRRARWAEHRAARRGELIDATVDAVRRHGATVGMDQIAAEAHTSKPVIYRYFTDKGDLYRAVGGRVADGLIDDIARATADVADPRARFAAGIDAFYQVLEFQTDLYRFVVAYPMLDGALGGARDAPRPRGEDIVADYISRVEQLVARLLMDARGTDLTAAQGGLWGTCVVGMVRSAGEWWLRERETAAHRPGTVPISRAELTEQVTTLIWNGVVGGLMGTLWRVGPNGLDTGPSVSAVGTPADQLQ